MADFRNPKASGEILAKRNVLIVEDEPVLRELLVKTLEKMGFNAKDAANGLLAKVIFDSMSSGISLIISDIRMPEMDGVALLKHVREKSDVPFLMMTGFSEVLESQSAHELGATEFLPKPFKANELMRKVGECLRMPLVSPVATDQTQNVPSAPKFCQIHINEFISSTRLLSDVYIRLTDVKYLKVALKGQEIPVDRLKVYKEKKVEHLYVTVEDFASYVKFNINLTETASKNPGVAIEKRARLLQNTSELIVQKCFVDGIDLELLTPAKNLIESTLKLISEDDKVLDMLTNIEASSGRLYAHSVAVSLYASMLAQSHGWTSSSTLFKVSLAALLHDIGKKEIPMEIIERPRALLTPDDIRLLETHPSRGRDILSGIKSLPEDIAFIVHHHHESDSGTGYPLRIKKETIHPIARLIHVADRFCHYILPVDRTQDSIAPAKAALKLRENFASEIDLDFLRTLITLTRATNWSPPAKAV